MSSDTDQSGNRATVALVYRAVDDLGKVMDAHFETIKVQLSKLDNLPAQVELHDRELAALRRKLADLTDAGLVERVAAIENSDQSQLTAAQRRRTLVLTGVPRFVVMLAGFVLVVLNILQLIHP